MPPDDGRMTEIFYVAIKSEEEKKNYCWRTHNCFVSEEFNAIIFRELRYI
jgi:hypothetical protein